MNKRVQQLQAICEKYDILALHAFGSRAPELLRALEDDSFAFESSPSDLDLGVFTQAHFPAENKVSMALDLENVIGAPRVDLFVLQEADAFLAANIVRGERIYTKDSYLVDEYELFVLGRAGDLAELERQRMAMILREG